MIDMEGDVEPLIEDAIIMKDVSWRGRVPRNVLLYSPTCDHIIPRKNTRAMAHLVPGGWTRHFCPVCKRPTNFMCVQNSEKTAPLLVYKEVCAAYKLIAG